MLGNKFNRSTFATQPDEEIEDIPSKFESINICDLLMQGLFYLSNMISVLTVVISISYFTFNLFSSQALFDAYIAFLALRVIAIYLQNFYVIYRLKQNFNRTEAIIFHSSPDNLPEQKQNDIQDEDK